MELNIGKCSAITFTRKKNVTLYDYSIDGENLKRVSEIKDLGIILDSKLTFDNHVNYVFRRCNKLLGFVFRVCRRFRTQKSIMFLYNSLIRSLCEYGAVIWNPQYMVYTNNAFKGNLLGFCTTSMGFVNLTMKRDCCTCECKNYP